MFKKVNAPVLLVLSISLLLILSSSVTEGQAFSLSGEISGGPGLTDTFTYQGYFEYAGNPANGYFDFQITIWDLQTLGTQIASCQTLDNIAIQDGLFTFHLLPNVSMNDVFDGYSRWLQVAVRPSGTATWTTLPRQPITAVPYAWNLRTGADLRVGTLYASNSTPTGIAISAHHTSDGFAVYGSTGGAYPAVGAFNSGAGRGLEATSETGIAVFGRTSSIYSSGVVGVQTGYSMGDSPYWAPGGFFGGINGVVGVTKELGGYGVLGLASVDSTTGIRGINSASSGYAGSFYSPSGANGVYINTDSGTIGLAVYGGSKSAAVNTDQGTTLLYTEESTEVWFTDYGFGTLDKEYVTIIIDPLFAQTVNLEEPYHVFLQAYGDAAIYVTNRTPQSFEVHLGEGNLPVEFSYRIVATRLGYEDHRLEPLQGLPPDSFDAIQQQITDGD